MARRDRASRRRSRIRPRRRSRRRPDFAVGDHRNRDRFPHRPIQAQRAGGQWPSTLVRPCDQLLGPPWPGAWAQAMASPVSAMPRRILAVKGDSAGTTWRTAAAMSWSSSGSLERLRRRG